MIADGAGNLYIAEAYSQTIRKLVIATGVVTTLAGDPGVSGSNDGTGATAHFHDPVGLTSDGAGNLYVADTGNHAIRKIAIATGVVTTVAGHLGVSGSADGAGAESLFFRPTAAALDGDNLYVADSGNCTIRKVVLATGAVSTFAGTAGSCGSNDGVGADALFSLTSYTAPEYVDNSYPKTFDLVSDGAGNLYFADKDRIRKIVIATAAVTTLAISPGSYIQNHGFPTDSNFAALTSDRAGNLYVSKVGSAVDKVNLATNQATPVPVSGSDPWGPWGAYSAGVACDPAGNIYVREWEQVFMVAPDGTKTALAGFVHPEKGSADGAGAAAKFNMPAGVAEDGSGHLYVADTSNSTLREIVLSTGVVTSFAGSPGVPGTSDGAGPVARFSYPRGMVGDDLGNVYVVDQASLRKVVLATGEVTTLVAPAQKPGEEATSLVKQPLDVTYDGAGSLYVVDFDGSDAASIRRVNIATGAVTTVVGPAETNNPPGTATPAPSDGVGTAARFVSPRGLTSDGDGNVYVADYTAIRKVVVATGEVTTLAGSLSMSGSADGAGLDARFNGANSIASDHAGNLYVADEDNHAVRKIVIATGVVTTAVGSRSYRGMILGPLPGSLVQPRYVSMLSANRLAITTPGAVLMAQF